MIYRNSLIKGSLLATAVLLQGFNVDSSQAQSTALRGKVVVDGSSTVYPVTEAAADDFRKSYPNVSVTVGISGTGGGFKRFAAGETDISDASRPIKAEEFIQAKKNNVEFIELPVAIDGLSVVVNTQNDWIDQLSVEDLQKIFLDDGKVRKWNDLNPAWPDQAIKLYIPGTDSGTFDYFREVVLPEGKNFRPDMSTSEDDNVLVTGVNGDKYALGFFGASYYYENKSKVKAVPIVNPADGKAYMPDPEYVIAGNYAPLSRPLFIYVNLKSLQRPEVRRFVDHYLENSQKYATQVAYVPIPEEIGNRAKSFLALRKAGSTYLTQDMKKREGGLTTVYLEDNLVSPPVG
jgi:phosphate transport system substrate-binding protein